MKRTWLAPVVVVALAAACASTPDGARDPYLDDASYRRATLVASLVNPENEYSRLRLASYDSGGEHDWSRLAEWNPRVASVTLGEIDRGAGADEPLGGDASALEIAVDPGDDAALVRLGERAFFRYPVQLARAAEKATASREAFARYGFWTDGARGAGGVVRVEVADGTRFFAYTCATCHAASGGGALTIGVGNDALDLGRLAVDSSPPGEAIDPAVVARWLSWGPGRLDVTTHEAREPVRIADLRPVRWLTHLQADASVAQKNRATLAIRIETLLVTAHDMAVRPPRIVALALAAYVWSLADALPPPRVLDAAESRGRAIFESTCARCHAPPAFTGPPVLLDAVGTDPTIGLSLDRGTGTYRVPSLHGVATRPALLHDASVASLGEMFDPARVTAGFGGGRRHAGPIAGHAFGLSLEAAERADLVRFLETL